MTEPREPTEFELRQKVAVMRRLIAAKESALSLIRFSKFMEPDPNAPDDLTKSLYTDQAHHRVVAALLEQAESGALLAQGIRYLCISIGPQKGKSQLVTRNFPAWMTGRNPKKNIMVGSYNDDFAREFGDDVRNIMLKPQYAQVFPRARLRKGGKAKDHMVTEAGGKLNFIGRGGSGTGKPADCLPGDSMILTERGRMRIDEFISAGMPFRIASFDHDTYNPVWRPVVAWSSREADEILQIETESGRVVRATGDHRIFTADRGYVSAAELSVGDALLCHMRQGCGAAQVCVGQEGQARHPEHVLQQGLPRGDIRAQMPMRAADWLERSAVLLRRLPESIRSAGRAFAVAGRKAVPAMWRDVQARVAQNAVLRQVVRQCCALCSDDWRDEFALQGWPVVCAPVQHDAGGNHRAGSRRVRGMSFSEEVASASYKSRTHEQRAEEFNSSMRDLPCDTSQVARDAISVVRRVRCAGERVYDIQVEGTGNFFADEILVHNCFIVDDPIKNAEEAASLTIRNTVWQWFLKVADSRTHGNSIVIVVQTRWSEDDLIGRLTDPTNPHYPKQMAAMTKYINIPSIVDDAELAKALGVPVGGSIWEEKFPLWLLKMKQDADARGFGALEMGRPTPPEGSFYKVDQIRRCWYKDVKELPKGLRKYGSGDLAVSDDLTADWSVVGDWGLDENDILWLMPEIYWMRKKADQTVEHLVTKGKDNWQTFFGEKGQIDRSIRPFLEKRMMEEECFFAVQTFPNVNKGQASLSFRGRLAQGKVRFPVFAEWYQRAEEQMLKFTGSGDDREDDFCDMLARIGQGLQLQVRGSRPQADNVVKLVQPGSIGWAFRQYSNKQEKAKKVSALRGM